MRALALFCLVALAAWAGTVVDQGSPGKSGAWSVSATQGGLPMPAKTDFIPRVTSSATNNVSISGHYDIVLLNN